MTPEGELIYDKRYPSTNESWSAIETVYLDDDNIIIEEAAIIACFFLK